MTEPADPPSVGDVVAERVRHYRLQRQLSVRSLAERCAHLGMEQLTPASLANIERGRDPGAKRKRREVSVDELMTLALALGVPPLLLLVPLENVARLRITPTVDAHPVAVWEWITGDYQMDGVRQLFDVDPVSSDSQFNAGQRVIGAYKDVANRVELIRYFRDKRDTARAHMGEGEQVRDTVRREFDELTARRHSSLANDVGLDGGLIESLETARQRLRSIDAQLDAAYREYEYQRTSCEDAVKELDRTLQMLRSFSIMGPPIPSDIREELEVLGKSKRWHPSSAGGSDVG